MTNQTRHHTTGELFRQMDDETLRKVMRRVYRFAADSVGDQQAAQAELRRRKNAAVRDALPTFKEWDEQR